MAFDETPYERDPHVAGVLVPGLLFIASALVQGSFQLLTVVVLAFDTQSFSNTLPVLAFSVVLRGLPVLVSIGVGGLLLVIANKGRYGRLPDTTAAILGLATLVGLGVAAWDFLTCNCLVLGIDIMPALFSGAATVFFLSRESA